MTHKYERQCWNCGSKNMEKLTNHVRCRDCGATWNFVPDVHLSPVAMDEYNVGTREKPIKVTESRPSGQVSRRAARARAKS